MSGPWENYQAGPWTQYQPQKPEKKEESGVLRQAADIPLSVGRGALSGVRMIADAFGAGSGVSEAIKGAEGYLADLMSAQAKNDQQEISRIMKDAEDKGMLEQVKAGVKAFTVAPADLLAQGFGSAAPAIAGMLGGSVLGVGATGARILGAGIGATMGAGTTKGSIYEETKKTLVDAGLDEKQAEERAQAAQSYGGKNLDQILLGTGLGAFASATGVENAVKNILTRSAAKEAAKTAAKEIPEEAIKKGAIQVAKARAGEAAAEGIPEFIQAGQEQAAQNIALQREGYDVPTMRGVVGAGVLEGLSGAGLGAGFGSVESVMRGQAQAEAKRILDEEERVRAEQENQRIAAEQQAADAELKAKQAIQEETYARVPGQEPLGGSITRTGAATLLGAPEDQLAGVLRTRREEQEAAAQVPLSEDYAFLQREKQRLMASEKTPEVVSELGRVDQQIQSILERDLSDAQRAKESAFGERELPPVESREMIMAEEEIARLQAKERSGEELTKGEIRSIEKLRNIITKTPMAATETEKKLQSLEKQLNQIKSPSLYGNLIGKLNPSEVRDISPDIGNNLRKKGGGGTFISELVSDGQLDDYLPPGMRPDSIEFDVQESTEYIKDKLRNKDTLSFDADMQKRQLQGQIDELRKEVLEPVRADYEISDAVEAEREAKTEALIGQATPEIESLRQRAADEGVDISAIEEQAFEESRANPDINPDTILAERLSDALGIERRYQQDSLAEASTDSGINIEPEDQRVEKELLGKSMIEVADWTINNAPNAFARVIAEKVKARLLAFQRKGMTLEFNVQAGQNRTLMMRNARGITQFDWGKDDKGTKISVTLNGAAVLDNQAGYPPGTRYATVLHELLHVATRAQFKFMPNSDPLKKQLIELFNAIADRFNEDAKAGNLPPVMQRYYKRLNNVLGDPDEMLAWGLTDKEVQTYFDDIKVGEKSVWSQLVELIRTALGLGKPYESALERLLRASDSLLEVDVNTIDAMMSKEGKQIGEKKKPAGPMVQETLFQKDGKPAAARDVEIPSFFEDIPNENWLQDKIDYAQRSPRNEFGVPKMSSVTGRFREPVMIPARWFKDVKGQRGEEKNVRQKDLEAIRKIIRDTGKFPLNEDGTEYVPYVEIGYDGKPWISEGNHRIMAAIAEGMEYIPVELRYFDGGQRRAGVWGPGNVASITERVAQEKPAAMRGQKPSEALKRWFGGSKIVNADGSPKVMYHGTKRDFTEFKPRGELIFVSTSPEFASSYAEPSVYKDRINEFTGEEETPSVMPVYVKAENPFDFRDPKQLEMVVEEVRRKIPNYQHLDEIQFGSWKILESDQVRGAIKRLGFDGLYIKEKGAINLAVFDPKQIKSATGNIGTFSPETADIRYQREGEPEGRAKEPKRNILGNPVLGSWTSPTDTKLAGTKFNQDDLIYSLQDKQIDIKRVVQSITNTAGRIAAKWNPYLQEELYHGRTARATKEFLQGELRPLIQEIQKSGMTIEEVEKYLHNRHAEAYNNHVAKVNPNNPRMQDGGSGIKTEDARKYLASIPADKRKVFEAIAKKVDAITKGTRKLVVDSGLESPETIAAWEKVFPDYVPLMREESDDFDYTTPAFGVGSGYDVRGKFSRAAMGSERKVANILANIAMQREKAIIKSNKNRVAQAVFGLAVQNPNPDFWLAVNPMAEKIPEIALDELRAMGIDEQAINFLMQEPTQRAIDPKKNEVVNRINATLRKSDNVLAMRVNGEDRYVFFNQNDPRAKRAAEALKNLDADQLGPILGIVSQATRWMASVNTQYNPIFGAYNFLRDVQGAALQLSNTPLAGMQKQVMSGVLPSLKAIYSSIRKERKGEKADTELAKLWNEFQEEGGQTGFRDMFSRSQERAEALEKEFKQITEGKAKAAGRAMLDWLSDYNDSMENATRLSAYKVAKEKFIKEGMSEAEAKQEAASIAKNLTVNFNRKGQIATQAGALYAFFNAAVQGTTRLAQTLSGPAGRKIIAGGLLLGTIQAAMLAAAGFDEEEPPEFVRERNIIIPIGEDKYLAFPMPLGYHVIPGFSRIITEWALSGFKNTPERIASLTGMFMEAFNPIGNAGWSVQTLAPTFADPFVALSENKDWTGKPIARKDFSNLDPTPGYTRAKDTATMFSTQLAKFLNYASGGTEFRPGVLSPTPDQIDYLIGQAFGGIGREATKLEQTIVKTSTGEELPPYKIPLVGRFYGETKSSAAESSRFYKNMTLLNEHENEIKGRRESRQPVAEYLQENPEARLAPLARKTYTNIQKLRKRREQLVEKDAPRESVKQVEEQIQRAMRTFNERVEKLKD